ncbi:protein associated with central pair microtubule complex [Haematococcus lacustris]
MSDILKSWLNEELGLTVENVERDFASGYLWALLFQRFGMQPSVDKFEDRRMPDAMVNNYTRLQPVFKRLNIQFDSRTANALMREEPGVALRLLYSIKQNLSQVKKDVEKFKHSGRLGRELGASQEPNSTLLEALQFNTDKQAYTQGSHRFFEESMRSKMPDTTNHLMAAMHLRRFSERQYRQDSAAAAALDAERQAAAAKQEAFRTSLKQKMSSTRSSKAVQLERDDDVHRSLMRRKVEAEREELRVELALAEASRRRKLEGQQLAGADVNTGIDAFEINMKRLLKGDGDGEGDLQPATTHTPLEHQAKLRAMATSTAKLLEETAGYLAGVRAQRLDDMSTKKEREARRRRMLVEQQAAAVEAERKAEAEALLQALARQSAEEQRLAERLQQLAQEDEVMRENRLLREQQYAERRAQDWSDTLRRELELHRSQRTQYEAQAAAEMAAWRQAQQERAAAKAAKHARMAEGMAWQLVQLAERCIEFRRITGELVPRSEWRRWVAMFLASDEQLGDPVVKEQAGSAADLALATAAVADWLDCVGEWQREEGEGGPIGHNARLAAIVAELDQLAATPPEPLLLPNLADLPLKLAVVGAPFSGKTTVAQELSKRFKLQVLEPEAMVAEAMAAADKWAAAGGSSAATPGPPPPADSLSPTSRSSSPSKVPSAAVAASQSADQLSTRVSETGPEADAAAAAAAAGPPLKVLLGQELQAALSAGQEVPDALLVRLMVLGMEEARCWQPPKPVELDPKTGKPKPSSKAAAPPKPGSPAALAAAAAAEEEAKPAQGFVLDGFPRTATQAAMLEQALTGLDLAAEQALVDRASKVAPPPPEALPQLSRSLVSGLDAVLVLGLTDPGLVLKRALGRRLDPATGKLYHLEFAPPPVNDPGLAARLQHVADPSNEATQVQQRLAAWTEVAQPLSSWHCKFSRLVRPISSETLTAVPAPPPTPSTPASPDPSAPPTLAAAPGTPIDSAPAPLPPPGRQLLASNVALAAVLESAVGAAEGVLRAKAAVGSCRAAAEAAQKARAAAEKAQEFAELARGHAEGAARELLVAKKAEIQAQALLDGTDADVKGKAATTKKDKKGELPPDPAAVEVLKAQAAAKCAEQLKVCRGAASDAAKYAERANTAASTAADAVNKAKLSLGDAEVSATAEVEAKAAANEAEQARAAAEVAAQKAQTALTAAEQAVKEADKFASAETVEPTAEVELMAPDDQLPAGSDNSIEAAEQKPPPCAVVPVTIAKALLEEWQTVESRYLDGLTHSFANLATRHDLAVAHFDRVQEQFKQLLVRPDTRVALLTQFQKDFNAVDVDARSTRAAQAELLLRCDELRDGLWALCDKKMEDAEAERSRIAADSFVSDHTQLLAQFYTSLAQLELDRFYASLTFAKGYSSVKYGVLTDLDAPPAASDPSSSPPDLKQGSVPHEVKDRLDEKSKTVMAFPSEVLQLMPKAGPLAQALKVALASAQLALAACIPGMEVADGKKGGAKKDAKAAGAAAVPSAAAPATTKGSKGAVGKGPEDADVPPEVAEAMAAEVAAVAVREGQVLEARIRLLAQRAVSSLDGLHALNTRLLDTLGTWVTHRFQAECSAVAAVHSVASAAAVAGQPLAADLRLEDGTLAVLDATKLVIDPHPGFPTAKPQERAPPSHIPSVAQLVQLVDRLVQAAPQGLLKLGELAELLLRAAGDGALPERWREASPPALLGAVEQLDPTFSGYADWREMVVCLVAATFPTLMQASCTDVADACELLLSLDQDGDGLLSEQEWLASELWFQRAPFIIGSEQDLEAEHALDREAARQQEFDRAGELKKVLWAAFNSPAPDGGPAGGALRVDLRTLLLYLCVDRDHFTGIKKAFSVAANSIASNARVDAEQLMKVAYPMGIVAGADVHRVPMDQQALAAVVETLHKARGGLVNALPAITAEQLMYSASGEQVVKRLLGRYQWKDFYTATKAVRYGQN